MGRPDWRAMLAGMSSTEYADWHRFYSTHYFHDVLLDCNQVNHLIPTRVLVKGGEITCKILK
ncbi:hypothetical protein CDW64_004038 [Escherichia coli]|nr:hypothetical protein [Escherichia coli]